MPPRYGWTLLQAILIALNAVLSSVRSRRTSVLPRFLCLERFSLCRRLRELSAAHLLFSSPSSLSRHHP